jgi:hypothetical protein
VLTPQHYHSTTGTLLLDSPSPEDSYSWVDYSRHELSRVQWALRHWFQLAEGWRTMTWKIAMFGSKPTTNGSESDRACYPLHHSAPQTNVFVTNACRHCWPTEWTISTVAYFRRSKIVAIYKYAIVRVVRSSELTNVDCLVRIGWPLLGQPPSYIRLSLCQSLRFANEVNRSLAAWAVGLTREHLNNVVRSNKMQ